jgi:REP element-mobilizing transposase RayT
LLVDRYWLLTWTTYGTWLPGDPRGSVTSVRTGSGPRIEHDQPGTPWEGPLPGLHAAARTALKGPPIYLSLEQAQVLLHQFQETAAYRGWLLGGVAVMTNHTHLVVGVHGDPDPEDIVGDFKSYGSRALNRQWGKPVNGSWWSGGSGSKRKLSDEAAVRAALEYVRRQYKPLINCW